VFTSIKDAYLDNRSNLKYGDANNAGNFNNKNKKRMRRYNKKEYNPPIDAA
jgi:hypothetical protein